MTRISVSGHFGEWIQGRLGPRGEIGLITVWCPALCVTVGGTDQQGHPFSVAEVRRFWQTLGVSATRVPSLRFDMPLGGGCGASTASLVALARYAGWEGDPFDLARACVAVEGATDPLMFDAPDRMVWASRQAKMIQPFQTGPCCEVIGGFFGDPVKTDPNKADFADVSDLIAAWSTAQELAEFADIASRSAARNRTVTGLADPMPLLARDLRALGDITAHTGSARGLIFPIGLVPDGWQEALRAAGLRDLVRFKTGRPE